jgi:peptide/nickel transport system permease protein
MVISGRIASMLVVVWLAATTVFFALRVLPGDAIEARLAWNGASAEAIQQRRIEMGLNEPILLQYGRFLANMVRGNLGVSLIDGQPVTNLILQRFGPTLVLASTSLLVATLLGLVLGTLAVLQVGQGVSTAARFTINLAISTPIYWTGTLALYAFTGLSDLLPAQTATVILLILPIFVLGFHTSGAIAKVAQANLRVTLSADFVRTARAKGLPESQIVLRHVLRVGLLPTLTVIALQGGFLLGGTVITESLFFRPGIGRLLLDRTLLQDYPVVQGIVILAALTYIMLNTTTELLYLLLDPRVRI